MTTLRLSAHGKINLTLEVLGERDDGYHEIASVMQTISLADSLCLEESDSITIECDSDSLATPQNLAFKAAELVREKAGRSGGVHIQLEKRIPVASGLGGGSSDAAAVLKALNSLWGLGMSLDELDPLAARLGSDVPFFLREGTAVVLGRGEKVRPVRPADLGWMVVAVPAVSIPGKTAAMYGAVASSDYTRGALTRKLGARIDGGGDVPPQFLFNAFDAVALEVVPELKESWDSLVSLGAREVHLAGSGPAMFAPVSRKELGTALQLVLGSRPGWQAHLVSAWTPDESGPG